MAVEFELKEGFNRAVVHVQGLETAVVLESGTHKVTDPKVIAALDESPAVKRADRSRAPRPEIVESADAKPDEPRKGGK